MNVNVGDGAPEFDLEGDDGKRKSLRDYRGKWLVLYFYPRDNTPGCTREAQDFSNAASILAKLGAEVAGVSRDSIKSHCAFRDKIGITFPLLSDPDLAIHRAYGAWGTKTMYGKKVDGTIRSTFLIDPEGKIARVWGSVKVDGHAGKVVDSVQAAKGDGGGAPKATKADAPKATKSPAVRSRAASAPKATKATAPKATKATAPKATKATAPKATKAKPAKKPAAAAKSPKRKSARS
jgi:peroxiredoxin Q/BCP